MNARELPDPLSFAARRLEELDARHERRAIRSLSVKAGVIVEREGRELVNLGSNDYLGLSQHPEVVAAAIEATTRWGTGSGSARLITGSNVLHDDLEHAIATFKGTEDAVLLSSGYHANFAAMTTLADAEAVVFSDALNHASLIDAIRLSGAHRHIYRHGDADEAAMALHAHRSASRLIVATDGVFSMDGDLAPLGELAKHAEDQAAILYVDDAHGTGVVGPGGRGSAAAAGVEAVTMGTLSKALGSFGGFVAGPKPLCELIRTSARTFIFDTALPPASVAAARTALAILERDPSLPTTACTHARRLADRLRDGGLEVNEPAAAVVPVLVGDSMRALEVAASLEARGFLVPAIRPPSVPRNRARLRASVSALHTNDQIDAAADAILEVLNP